MKIIFYHLTTTNVTLLYLKKRNTGDGTCWNILENLIGVMLLLTLGNVPQALNNM